MLTSSHCFHCCPPDAACVSIPDLQSMLVRHLSSGERILTPYMKRMGIPAVVSSRSHTALLSGAE